MIPILSKYIVICLMFKILLCFFFNVDYDDVEEDSNNEREAV